MDSNYSLLTTDKNESVTAHSNQKPAMDGYHPRQQSFSLQTAEGSNAKPSGDNCDSKRPEEVEDTSRLSNVSQQVIDKTVTPFLREHIPASYALVGKLGLPNVEEKPPNSKYCYRHQPDSKCHRAADASKMAFIQSVCNTKGNYVYCILTQIYRSLRPSLTAIARLSPSCGLYFPQPQLSTAILCCKVSLPSAAFHNYPWYREKYTSS